MTEDKYTKTVSAKLSRKDFVSFKNYCDRKGVKVSSQLKQMVEQELQNPKSLNLAGRNSFSYNRAKDNFNWNIELDSKITAYIEDGLSSEFLKQLKESIEKAIDERNTFLQKSKRDSVPIPAKLMRKSMIK